MELLPCLKDSVQQESAVPGTMERTIITLAVFGALILCVTSVQAKKVRSQAQSFMAHLLANKIPCAEETTATNLPLKL